MLARLVAVAVLVVSALVLAGQASPAYACSCVQGDTRTYAESADAVFTGTVTHRSEEGPGFGGSVTYDVSVATVYKGEVGSTATVTTAAHGASCGLPHLPEGEPVLFFATGDADGLSVTSCLGTGPATAQRESEVVTVLGDGSEAGPEPGTEAGTEAGTETEPEQDDSGTGPLPWALGGGALALAAAALGLLVWRRVRQESS